MLYIHPNLKDLLCLIRNDKSKCTIFGYFCRIVHSSCHAYCLHKTKGLFFLFHQTLLHSRYTSNSKFTNKMDGDKLLYALNAVYEGSGLPTKHFGLIC